jgi:4-diphosphocytidyl-2-C-methyl-D-erythritol kinase
MTNTVSLKSPAKVNLRLEILRRRDDGYHDLRTVFQKISLHDTLHFTLKKERGVSITADHPKLPVGKKNLVYRAVQSMLKVSGYRGGVYVEIEKRIPLGAGLGGGSSNAATALIALNHLLEINLSKKKLMEMGLQIGADVPFFFLEGAAIGSGIGEQLKKLTLPNLWYVLIYPNFEVSTRWAYQNFVLTHSTVQNLGSCDGAEKARSGSNLSLQPVLRTRGMHQPSGWVAEGLTKKQFHINLHKFLKTPDGISRILLNHLEAVVSKKYPQIDVMKSTLLSVGALGAMMTGSGPTVFGLFPDAKDAALAYDKIKTAKNKGWEVIRAHSITA